MHSTSPSSERPGQPGQPGRPGQPERSRRPWWLVALALAAFAVQTDDYIVIGVLPDISADVRRSETLTGQLVTVYSLVCALAAPLWALLPFRVPRRRALCGALTVFAAANFAVPLTTSYAALMALRVVAALSAAVVLPIALAAAGSEAPPERRGRYLATVLTGLTGAVLIGVPAGTWIGAVFDWRATFAFAGLLGAGALLATLTMLPAESVSAGVPRPTPADLVRPLLNGTVAAVLAVTVLAVAGNLAFQTYLAPFLAEATGATPRTLAALLVCSGIGGLLGTQTSGRLIDRCAPLRAFVVVGTVFCAAMLALAALWPVRPVPTMPVALLLAVWSAAAWAVPPAVQSLMLSRAGAEAAAQAMAVQGSSVYVGAALGSALGGAVVAVDLVLLPVAAVALVSLGLLATPLIKRSA
ncbi:MFS transporter [Streptomyces sp. I05A-00742]|uniref:MFS transporter n=1 Tax=Streptomyces sp. I05A-00742 TaxID=2732853 RepID=UPI00148798BF|nr:MFS transporter [Streptomyces sp. I05A-00742]